MKLRLNPNRLQQVFKDAQDIQELIKTTTDLMFAVCPFTIILGTLNTTEAGYKPPNLIVNNYTNFSKVFTGRESVLAVWDDCYETSQVITPLDKGGDETNNYGIVKVRQNADGSNGGKRYYGRLLQSAVITSFKPNTVNDTMNQMSATKTVNLIFEYNKNETLFDEITNNIYKFFIIPELFEFKDSKDNHFLSTDRQWYYLENCIVIYNSKTKQPEILQATFTSVNDVISKSGLAINQYIQISAPGDRCCFPTVDENSKKIVCDKEMLKCKPITHVQISLFGNVSFSSIVFMGRPCKVEQPQIEWKIEAPRFIFPHKYQASSYDELFVNAVPETNYYLMIGAIPTIIEGWSDWKDKISSTYNAFKDKQYEGFLAVKIDETKKTNIDASIPLQKGLHLQYWDPRFLKDRSVWPNDKYNVSGSEYFCINPNLYNSEIKYDYCGEWKISLKGIVVIEPSLAILNIYTFFTHKQFYQLPITITQTTPYAFSSLPIIGRFLNVLMIGLPFGFRLSSNVVTPRIPAISALFSCEQFDYLTSIFSTTAKNNIPFDIFRKDTSTDIYSMCGTTSQTTSLCFNLSNQIIIYPTKIDGVKPDYDKITNANYNQKKTIDSVKLGQIDKKNMEAYLIGGVNNLANLEANAGFIIDSFCFQALGQVPYRITFYSQTDNPQGNLDNTNSVWTGVYKTLSSASQNTRQWTNFMILSNPQYRFDKNFYYPQNVYGAPNEGEFVKEVYIREDVYYEGQNQVGLRANYYVLGKVFVCHWKGSTYQYGYYCNITRDQFEYEKSFYIDDIELGLENYKANKITITTKYFNAGIDTKKIYNWGSGATNLSQGGNFWIYGMISDSDTGWFPLWAQDPGKYGDKFDLTTSMIDEMNYTIDLTNLNDEVVSLESRANMLNEDHTKIVYDLDGRVDDFRTDLWPYKGEFLKAHHNLTCVDNVYPRPNPPLFYLGNSNGGINIYIKQILSPVLKITKQRDETNKRWKITLKVSYSIEVNGNCLAQAERWESYDFKDRDILYHNFFYYINNGANPTYYYVKHQIIDKNVIVKYISKNNKND